MSALRLAFYGDDFTGSTDALEVLAFAGLRCALFLKPPTPGQLDRLAGYDAIGVAGDSRGMSPAEMDAALPAVFDALAALGAPIVHYKVCSTFDSSPAIGSMSLPWTRVLRSALRSTECSACSMKSPSSRRNCAAPCSRTGRRCPTTSSRRTRT